MLKHFPFPLFLSAAAINTALPGGRTAPNLANMETDTLLEALKDFEKKGKKEVSLVLEQFLCHVAKTGETMVSWSQFKSYFLFKLEKVMEDFRASAPEQRGPANPNVESVPFEEMKERILKIVDGYNGIPFTIQRLCELLTDPKRNYTGTEKFLRGVEKNVMVVSCVYPTSEKNGCSGVNRMNGVMLPGNTSIFTDRKVNGPGTPRPPSRPKLSASSPLATNGLPDSTESRETSTAPVHSKLLSDAPPPGFSCPLSSSLKNKHAEEEEGMEEENHEVKRLKFSEDSGEEEEEEEEEEDGGGEEESSGEALRAEPGAGVAEDSGGADSPTSMMQDKEEVESAAATSTAACEDQEPSSTQSDCAAGEREDCEEHADTAEREVPCGSDSFPEEPSDMDQSEQRAPASSPERREGEEFCEPVSSSEDSRTSSNEPPASTDADSPTEGDVDSGDPDSESTEEPMDQD
ncbi:serine/threonine-protein phosphatase 4 regulatory subunit 2-B [Brachyhypopomus gauderio]|uniref:serine/threonine-protein phosphatase 4 regulatory subunit 2-B n=1 Tax=Brachyhypopomus gauderio TaxID=698409 RepID=UPI0040426FBB